MYISYIYITKKKQKKIYVRAIFSRFSISGEKSNKCKQCAFKSSHVDNLRTYLKTHNSKKAKPMQPMQLYFHSGNLRTQRTYRRKSYKNAISVISVAINLHV